MGPTSGAPPDQNWDIEDRQSMRIPSYIFIPNLMMIGSVLTSWIDRDVQCHFPYRHFPVLSFSNTVIFHYRHFPYCHFPLLPFSITVIFLTVIFQYRHFPYCHFPVLSISSTVIFHYRHFPLLSFSITVIFHYRHFPLLAFSLLSFSGASIDH